MLYPLAEQIVNDAGSNQWFVQFYETEETFDLKVKIDHMEFFARHGLIVQPVRSIQDVNAVQGFYHVRFKGKDDSALKLYSETFEDEQGISLNPLQYQMFEWSYSGWVKDGGPDQLTNYLQQQTA